MKSYQDKGLALLERTIDQIGDVRLIIIDPISSYMGAIDSHKNTDVRSVLGAVGEMAERRHTAIVGITHFSKGAGRCRERRNCRGARSDLWMARRQYGFALHPGGQPRSPFESGNAQARERKANFYSLT